MGTRDMLLSENMKVYDLEVKRGGYLRGRAVVYLSEHSNRLSWQVWYVLQVLLPPRVYRQNRTLIAPHNLQNNGADVKFSRGHR